MVGKRKRDIVRPLLALAMLAVAVVFVMLVALDSAWQVLGWLVARNG